MTGRGTSERGPATDAADWTSIVAVTIGITTFAVALGLTYPLVSLLLLERGVSETMIGLNAAAFMLGLGASTLAMPRLTVLARPRNLITVCLVFAAVVLYGFRAFNDLAVWFLLRFALGFCVNTIYVLGEAWLNAAATDSVRGRAAGIYSGGMAAGFALGPLGISVFGAENGFAFAACAVLVAFVSFAFGILVRKARVEPEAMPSGSLLAFVRASPLIVALVLLFGITDATALAILPVYLRIEGLSVEVAALILTVLHVGIIIAQPGLGVLLDRFNRWNVLLGCLLISAISFMVLMALPVTSWLLWPVAALCGAGFLGVYTACLALLGQEFKGGLLVVGSAVFALAYAVGGIIGPPAAGAIMEFDSRGGLVLLAIISITGAIAVFAKKGGRPGG
jgi:MFS family permease